MESSQGQLDFYRPLSWVIWLETDIPLSANPAVQIAAGRGWFGLTAALADDCGN
jgi:hypothetical protein